MPVGRHGAVVGLVGELYAAVVAQGVDDRRKELACRRNVFYKYSVGHVARLAYYLVRGGGIEQPFGHGLAAVLVDIVLEGHRVALDFNLEKFLSGFAVVAKCASGQRVAVGIGRPAP